MTKQELLNVLEEFYTPEKQKQYGQKCRIEKLSQEEINEVKRDEFRKEKLEYMKSER